MGRRRPKKRPPAPSEPEDEFLFPVSAEVEVRSDDPGFQAAFYEATVAAHLYGNRYMLLVQERGPLKDTAAAADVRPRPPPTEENAPAKEFAIYDMVEAFHNDRWWAGVVSGDRGDRKSTRLNSSHITRSRMPSSA